MDPARLRELVEVAILCSLGPDDTTRRAYLRNRWHGRAAPTRTPDMGRE